MNQDAQLIREILAGDTRSLEPLIRKHYGSIYAQVLLWTRHPDDAQDIAQDVFLKAYRNLALLRHPESFEAWLRQIARRECLNRLRRKRPDIQPLTNAEPDRDRSAEARLIHEETFERTMRAIDKLPGLDASLLKARYLDDVRYADLQSIHSLTYKAVTMRILRAKRKVRKQLEETFTDMRLTPDEEALTSATHSSPLSRTVRRGAPSMANPPFDFKAPYAAKKDDKFGYIDKTGEMVIPPRFERAMGFAEGLGRVGIGDKQGYIDKTGKVVIPLKFDEAHAFREGLAGARIGDQFGFIDKTGVFVVQPRFDHVEHFSEGIAAVMVDGRWGYINQQGDYIVEPQFTKVWPFNDGVAPVVGERRSGYIDATGKPIYFWETGSP